MLIEEYNDDLFQPDAVNSLGNGTPARVWDSISRGTKSPDYHWTAAK